MKTAGVRRVREGEQLGPLRAQSLFQYAPPPYYQANMKACSGNGAIGVKYHQFTCMSVRSLRTDWTRLKTYERLCAHI